MDSIILALEGIDGAGKTTLINELEKIYSAKCVVYHRTKKGSFISKLVSSRILKKFHFLQAPIYILIAWNNYKKDEFKKDVPIVLMDRCFLSNICYFYPKALSKKAVLKLALLFEAPVFPQKIFIIDADPRVAQKRDGFQKSLKWLEDTQKIYLTSADSNVLKKYNIEVIWDQYSITEKVNIIVDYINQELNLKKLISQHQS